MFVVKQNPDGPWLCPSCLKPLDIAESGLMQPCIACSGPAPSLLQKAANFATSAAAHVAAGMPQASQEQIDARFAICQGCEHFDGKACVKCGCPVVRERQFISKLAWANERCPAGKWGPVG